MGQVQSDVATDAHQAQQTPPSSPTSPQNPQPPSLDSLISEAAAYGDSVNESLDAKAQKALECPCIADLRSGSCGSQFSDAFLCFFKSSAEEKGSDCVHPFVALQACIQANPDAFSKDILDDSEVNKEQEPAQIEQEPAQIEQGRVGEYKIIPPKWATESASPKSKL